MSFELNTGERAAAVWTGRGDRPPGAEWVIPGWLEYVEMARQREYRPDPKARDAHSFLLSLGVEEVPHSSAADDLSTVGSPAELLALGNFWEHLYGNEMVMRQWQQKDPEGISNAACLGGLCHSIYGTQGFQGFAFPVEQRDALKEIIGERAEFLAYVTCAKDSRSYSEYVRHNRHLRRGETPTGSFAPRNN